MLGGKGAGKVKNSAENPKTWQATIKRVAPGFSVKDVGEDGVKFHKNYRGRLAVQTHPLEKKVPAVLSKRLSIPKGKKTELKVTVTAEED